MKFHKAKQTTPSKPLSTPLSTPLSWRQYARPIIALSALFIIGAVAVLFLNDLDVVTGEALSTQEDVDLRATATAASAEVLPDNLDSEAIAQELLHDAVVEELSRDAIPIAEFFGPPKRKKEKRSATIEKGSIAEPASSAPSHTKSSVNATRKSSSSSSSSTTTVKTAAAVARDDLNRATSPTQSKQNASQNTPTTRRNQIMEPQPKAEPEARDDAPPRQPVAAVSPRSTNFSSTATTVTATTAEYSSSSSSSNSNDNTDGANTTAGSAEPPPAGESVDEWVKRARTVGSSGPRPERWLVAPGSAAARPYNDTNCGSRGRMISQRYKLRVVSNPSLEKSGVVLIADKYVLSNSDPDSPPPRPIMTGRQGQRFIEHCKSNLREDNWKRVCPSTGSQRDHDWWKCDVRQFVAKLKCGYVDTDPVIPGMAYDSSRTFPVHGNHPGKSGFQPLAFPPRNPARFKTLAHNLAVYPSPHGGAAHFFNQLPRLLFLLRTLPASVPILLSMHRPQQEMVELLHERGLMDPKRAVAWDQRRTYFAETLYFAGELGLSRSTDHKWDSLRIEHCSWAMALPRTELQRAFTKDYVQRAARKVIMVVDRSDAGNRRRVQNNGLLMQILGKEFPNCTVRTFLGRDHNTSRTVQLWNEADVVVAPHGAALAFMAFMRPGRAVVEIGYDSFRSGGMKYPLSYFMAIARSVGLEYYVSIARGSYGGPMTANVADILLLVKEAVAKVKMLPIGAGAWPPPPAPPAPLPVRAPAAPARGATPNLGSSGAAA